MRRLNGTARTAVIVGLFLVATSGLAACGDPVTGPQEWNVTAIRSSHSGVDSGNVGYLVQNLRGQLLDARGVPIPGSSFSEQCTAYATGFTSPHSCLLVVNTGAKVYVAQGPTDQFAKSPFPGIYKTEDGTGTVTVSAIATSTLGGVEKVLVQAHTLRP
jgi:hypothetical protein